MTELTKTYVTAKEVCETLNIHNVTLQRMVKERRIDCINLGTTKRYNLNKFIQDNLSQAS